MRTKKSPLEKKRLSLDRDHPLQAKYPHGFRKSWPRKKRRAQQAFRRKVIQALRHAAGPIDTSLDFAVDIESPQRERVRKWGAKPLGEVIAAKRRRRIRSYRRKKDAQLLCKNAAVQPP